ncbi:MAG: phosphotransferase [Anaerolineae bacterium]|nr:phosphotransferase [Anaerolineae bacterium]
MRVSKDLSHRGAACFELDLDTLRFLGGEDGDVYEGRDADGLFIFKLVPTDSQDTVKAEEKLDFACYLSDSGVRVARPLPSPQGNLLEILTAGEKAVIVSKITKAPGHHPTAENPNEWTTTLFCEWGRVIGQMHALTQRYAGGQAIGQWDDEVASFIDWCHDAEVLPYWQRMRAHLETLPRDMDSYGLIHNDLHHFNFMFHKGEITVFDFDVCGHHWFMTDIGIALFHALWSIPFHQLERREAFAAAFLTSFMDGYEAENHLDETWLQELPTFLNYRQLLLFTVFTDSWGGADASSYQRRWLRDTRRLIVDDVPVVSLDSFFGGNDGQS